MKVRKAIGRILKMGTLTSTWGLIAVVLLQIICRFSPIDTPAWTEEASRIFFIYAISFAAGLAMKNDYYVHLDTFYNRFSSKFQTFLTLAVPVISFVLFLIMVVFALQFIRLGIAEKSPGMNLNMSVAFFSMLIMAAAICYYLAIKITRIFKSRKL